MVEKDNVVSLPDINAIYAEASEWLVLLEDGDVSAEDMAAFNAWCAKSERHRQAFDERAALWEGFDRVSALQDYAEADETAFLLKEKRSSSIIGGLPRRAMLSALAASLALSVGIGSVLLRRLDPISAQRNVYRTTVGEQQVVELSDGSRVHLNTDSEVEVRYTRHQRIVRLARGEAYFDVERDLERPFSVIARENSVTAIGTAFSVRLLENKLDVTVTHGRVALFSDVQTTANGEISSSYQEKSPLAELAAGQNVQFDREIERIETVEPEVMARLLSWKNGLLAFDGERLSDVVADIGRYTGLDIEIEDDALADVPIKGYVKIGEYEEMFEALEIMVGLEAVRVSPKRVRLVKSWEK